MNPVTGQPLGTALLALLVLSLGPIHSADPEVATSAEPPDPHVQSQGTVDSVETDQVVLFEQGICGQTVTGDLTLSRDLRECADRAVVIAADDVVLDCNGHTVSGEGSGHGVHCVDCNNVTIRNCLIENFEKGIYLSASSRADSTLSTNNTIRNNTLARNEQGVVLMWSHHSKILDNLIVDNSHAGIALTGDELIHGKCSDHNTISGNTVAYNRRGLVTLCPYLPQEGNLVENNTFSRNAVSVTDRFETEDRIRYRSNTFNDNLTTVFFAFEGDHDLEPGRSRELDISVHRTDGQPCSDFVIRELETSPRERVAFSKSANHILASFSPRREGLYSLGVTISGCGQESVHQRYWLGKEESTTLYLTGGHRRDVGRLISRRPEDPVYVYCTMWVQASVLDAPAEAGIAKMTKSVSSMWSNYVTFPPSYPYENLSSIEFDHTFGKRADVLVSVDGEHEAGRANVTAEFHKGLFLYDIEDWRALTFKYWGRDPDWISDQDVTSLVRIEYLVTDDPLILGVSDRDVQILSATSPVKGRPRSEIVLQGKGETSLSVQMGPAAGPYRVSFDGERCDGNSACVHTQEAGLVRLEVELDAGRQHTISMVGKKTRSTSGD